MKAFAAVFVYALSSLTAWATEHPEAARMLSLKASHGRPSLTWVTVLPAPLLPAKAPTVVGARLRVDGGSGESAWIELPAAGWKALNSGGVVRYAYAGHPGPGPTSAVKMALLRDQRILRVSARGTGITLNEASQGVVAVRLVIGSDVYCSACPAPVRDRAGEFVARQCPAPADCVLCGDGVAESGEACDGSDVSGCPSLPPNGLFTAGCNDPASSNACGCCLSTRCIVGSGNGGCCDGKLCQNDTLVGMVHLGHCVPPECSIGAECASGECIGSFCCAAVGESCLGRECCSAGGAVCDLVDNGLFCCLPAGTPCSDGTSCCSQSCTAGACD